MSRYLWAFIFGLIGVICLPYLKEPLEIALSFGEPYTPLAQLFVDHIYLVVVVMWVGIILGILLWKRKSPNEIESQ